MNYYTMEYMICSEYNTIEIWDRIWIKKRNKIWTTIGDRIWIEIWDRI